MEQQAKVICPDCVKTEDFMPYPTVSILIWAAFITCFGCMVPFIKPEKLAVQFIFYIVAFVYFTVGATTIVSFIRLNLVGTYLWFFNLEGVRHQHLSFQVATHFAGSYQQFFFYPNNQGHNVNGMKIQLAFGGWFKTSKMGYKPDCMERWMFGSCLDVVGHTSREPIVRMCNKADHSMTLPLNEILDWLDRSEGIVDGLKSAKCNSHDCDIYHSQTVKVAKGLMAVIDTAIPKKGTPRSVPAMKLRIEVERVLEELLEGIYPDRLKSTTFDLNSLLPRRQKQREDCRLNSTSYYDPDKGK